ncbi:hypothetical protein TSAR_006352 [Trichomalopsis sarcophagae]|uniref:Uncharacterized protein n=1 Tax=Trichomalopsis sarcophagae TaxID=543379 RepID=A0A232FLI9_9HYME|nr:hypothetical protein TSAR_006352 [Trichomalopsis sarcophagae]
MAECQKVPNYFLCKENGRKEGGCKHVAGSGDCNAFRRALDTAKKKEGRF